MYKRGSILIIVILCVLFGGFLVRERVARTWEERRIERAFAAWEAMRAADASEEMGGARTPEEAYTAFRDALRASDAERALAMIVPTMREPQRMEWLISSREPLRELGATLPPLADTEPTETIGDDHARIAYTVRRGQTPERISLIFTRLPSFLWYVETF